MTQTLERRSGGWSGAQKTAGEDVTAKVPQTADDLCHWHDLVEWWTDPRLSYARGLEDGYRLARQEIEAEDEQLHRDAVRSAIATMDRVDRRRLADAGCP